MVDSPFPAEEQRRLGLDPSWLALSRLRRKRFSSSAEICTQLLEQNSRDQAVWFMKCRALTMEAYVEDLEVDEEGVGEVLMDDNATATVPRPGTSLSRPQTKSGAGDASVRPMTNSGRPVTGFTRPSVSARPPTGSAGASRGGTASADQAFRGTRPGTSRPATSLGREVRLGTASMASTPGGPFIHVDRIDPHKYAQRPALGVVLTDYLLFFEHDPRRALDLCAEGTKVSDFRDWWWKFRLGKCYYKLGLFRDAERQLKSSLKEQEMVETYLQLAHVYLRLDVPTTALSMLAKASSTFPGESRLTLQAARVYDMLNNVDKSLQFFKKTLVLEASNVEAIACIAAHHFYSDQPELALRYYRRLLQMGINTTEIWNNLGLCCFFASQYDMALTCFIRALNMAADDAIADVWFNIGHVALGSGDSTLAYQAFKAAVAADPNHVESLVNLGVLEMRKREFDDAQADLQRAQQLTEFMFEPFYNGALLAFRQGDFQEAFRLVSRALELFPDHGDSKQLEKQLLQHFAA